MSTPRPPPPCILVCTNRRLTDSTPSCAARGSLELLDSLRSLAVARGVDVRVETRQCFGLCGMGPNVRFFPGGAFVRGARPADAADILQAYEAWLAGRDAVEGRDR